MSYHVLPVAQSWYFNSTRVTHPVFLLLGLPDDCALAGIVIKLVIKHVFVEKIPGVKCTVANFADKRIESFGSVSVQFVVLDLGFAGKGSLTLIALELFGVFTKHVLLLTPFVKKHFVTEGTFFRHLRMKLQTMGANNFRSTFHHCFTHCTNSIARRNRFQLFEGL